MAYTLRGKIELSREHLQNPESAGIVAQKVGLDLDIIDENGHELSGEEVIAAGFAWKSRFGFHNEAGEEVVLFEGKGAAADSFSPGKSRPNPGYVLEGAGISALEDSNGLRLVANFKHQDEGYFTAFGEVEGVGSARFVGGDTFRVGKARPRRGHGR